MGRSVVFSQNLINFSPAMNNTVVRSFSKFHRNRQFWLEKVQTYWLEI